MTLLSSLQNSRNPHLFLLHVGLTEQHYEQTTQLSLVEKQALAKKIVDKTTDEEMLVIISHLAELEFASQKNDHFRNGNHLANTVIQAYVNKHEADTLATHFIDNKKDLSAFSPDINVAAAWFIINKAAHRTLSQEDAALFLKNGKSLPAFWYQGVISSTDQYALDATRYFQNPVLEKNNPDNLFNRVGQMASIKNAEPSKEFGDKLHKQGEIADPSVHSIQDIEISNKLAKIKQFIANTQWKLGGLGFFQGGILSIQGQRLPHRVNDIFNLIDQAEKNPGQSREIYAQIVNKAEDAINNPRCGQQAETKKFYQSIINHVVLNENYFREAEAILSKGR